MKHFANMLSKIKDWLSNRAFIRCAKCPCFHHYYGIEDYIESCRCHLHNDIDDFCKYSLYPRWVMRIILNQYWKGYEIYARKYENQDNYCRKGE